MLTDPSYEDATGLATLARMKGRPAYWVPPSLDLLYQTPLVADALAQDKGIRAGEDGLHLKSQSPTGKRYAY